MSSPSSHQHPHHGEYSPQEYNIFRDSLLRYCGYANEVGESFRYQYPRFVVPSYIIAATYCLGDASSDVYKIMSEDENNDEARKDTRSKEVRAAIVGFDTLLWQGLASVAIPGGIINMIVRSSRFAVARTTGLPILISRWLPTAMGLGSVPIIITPIDNFVDYALDNSTRKMLGITSPEERKE